MNGMRKRFEDIAWKSPFWRKWTSVIYLHRNYGYSRRDLLAMYGRSVDAFRTGPRRDSFLGFEVKDVSGMYEECADRQYRESEQFACVFGCCTVLWHNGRNIGGMGKAGCPCDGMDDPRDVTRGAIA